MQRILAENNLDAKRNYLLVRGIDSKENKLELNISHC